ncbi:lysophospholipase-like protein 1 [Ptychodera flava]|uniref:lysophospholipase-like protein 1 n=1 Tax=Ptychodera flava TaxID=63121 RepID=UPI00396A8817
MTSNLAKHYLKTCLVAQTQKKHTATVIFLHGSGDTGEGVRAWVRDVLGQDFAFPHIKVIYPTAPERPYTPMMGHLSTVWFDRRKIANNVPENLDSVDSMADALGQLINAEVSQGIPKERIVVGGFSMGGAMAMHLGYRFHHDLAGVFALSSFLNIDSAVYKVLREQQRSTSPPLFMCQGTADPLVMPSWAETTHTEMKQLGVSSEFHVYKGLFHEMCKEELLLLKEWLLKHLPFPQ